MIRKTHGKVSSIAKLAKLAGQSLAARRDYERREQVLQRAQELQMRAQLQQYETESRMKSQIMAMDWENKKLALRSQSDFAIEEMRQQALSQREIGREIKKLNEYDLAKDKLNEHLADRNISQDQYNQAMANLDMKVLGQAGVLPRPQATDHIQELIKQTMVERETTTPASIAPVYATNPKTKERIVSNDGGKTWSPVATPTKKEPPINYRYGQFGVIK